MRTPDSDGSSTGDAGSLANGFGIADLDDEDADASPYGDGWTDADAATDDDNDTSYEPDVYEGQPSDDPLDGESTSPFDMDPDDVLSDSDFDFTGDGIVDGADLHEAATSILDFDVEEQSALRHVEHHHHDDFFDA